MSDSVITSLRQCGHGDWHTLADAGVSSCLGCGLTFRVAGFIPPVTVYATQQQTKDGQTQPKASLKSGRFSYAPLGPAHQSEIRMLDLQPGAYDDPLQCRLEKAVINPELVYEAVSYTWADSSGNDRLISTIRVLGNGEAVGGDIAITRNCEAMLRRLRNRHQSRRLWVDAVCINQENLQERNHQVQAMTAIFRGAERVVVYLGESDPVLDRLVEYIAEDKGGDIPSLMDFLPLFRTRWFHRVWVLQEIAVAKNAIVTLGERSLKWEVLLTHARIFLFLVNQQRQYTPLPPVLAYGFHSAKEGKKMVDKKLDFLSLMLVSRDCSCKDPRDKIYALLGLASEDSRPPMEADYSPEATTDSVFVQLATWHVSATSSPRILEHVEGVSKLREVGMPTWVPDWTMPGPRSPLPPIPETGLSDPPGIIPLSETSICKALRKGTESLEHAIARRSSSQRKGEGTEIDALPGSGNGIPNLNELGPNWRSFFLSNQHLSGLDVTCGFKYNNSHAEALAERLSLDTPGTLDRPVLQLRGWMAGHVHFLGLLSGQTIARNIKPRGALGASLDEDDQLSFWEAIWLRIRGENDKASRHRLLMELTRAVPLAFGGPCEGCKAPGDKSLWRQHFHPDLQDLLHQLQLYGEGRRLFTTEYSLGFGHQDMLPADEVWVVDRVSMPLILRPVSDKLRPEESRPNVLYRVVGGCYVHAVTRMMDKCLWCANSYERERIHSIVRQDGDRFVSQSKSHQWKQTLELV